MPRRNVALVIASRGMTNVANILVLVRKQGHVVEMKEDSNAVMMLNPAVDGNAVTLT